MQATKDHLINPQTTADKELLKGALGALEQATGATAHILEWQPKLARGEEVDAVLEVKKGTDKARYIAEIKRALPMWAIGHTVAQLRRHNQPAMLVTRYVTPTVAEHLKALDVAFLDMVGNTYINAPGFFVYVTGRKPPPIEEKARPVKAFRPTGLQVVFALLCRPELVNAPYRDIAKAANVALGTVGWVMYDLRGLNYIVERGKRERKFLNKRKLLDAWVTAYAQQLRPKLYIGRFRARVADWWKDVNWKEFNAFLGGEPAAAKLTGYLKPETAMIYAAHDIHELLIKYHLKKDPQGDVEILKAFWHFKYLWNYPDLTPPLLIYADLLATADERNIETGKLIYDQYLARLVGEV
jgi:hypothetical protein